MRILRAIVKQPPLGDLVDKEVQEDAEEDALVEGAADQVVGLVVDAMQLLQPLEVALRGGRVRDGPQAQRVHMAQQVPVMLEGNLKAFLLHVGVFVNEVGLADVVDVRDGLAEVLSRRFQVRQLVHFFFPLNNNNYNKIQKIFKT